MNYRLTALAGLIASTLTYANLAESAELCQNFGPQTPRDIASTSGQNSNLFAHAPAATALNLCNIHFHTNAEHKGPDFSLSAGSGENGGYRCNDTTALTPDELTAPPQSACRDLKPGDTVEVHWVHTSCDITPGPGLGSCSSTACINPQLRVETQVFLVVNDRAAADFSEFAYDGNIVGGRHQAKALPTDTGTPVLFHGSTTGPKYTEKSCSPLQVTWSVRPNCAKIDILSLAKWCEGNDFNEDHAHGVRQLVTAPALLAPIQ